MTTPDRPDDIDPVVEFPELLAELQRPESLAALLELRSGVAEAPATDAALADLSEALLLQGALSPGLASFRAFLAQADDPESAVDLDAEELARDVIRQLDRWGLRADGLARAGHPRVAERVGGHRLVGLDWLADHVDLLLAVAEVAAEGVEGSPLGRRSAWALVLSEVGPLGEGLPLVQGLPLGGSLDAIAPSGPLVLPITVPPAGARLLQAVAARGDLSLLLTAAQAASQDAPPELDPPELDAMVWAFADGSRLYVEQAAGRFILRVRGLAGPETLEVDGPVRRRWDLARSVTILGDHGDYSLRLGDERVTFSLGGSAPGGEEE